jgi:hypothetical protein
VILEVRRPIDISKVGINFSGTTKSSANETQLFSIQDILWDAAPSKGKAPAKSGVRQYPETETDTRRKVLRPTSGGVGHTFLFAIKWPSVNFPPSLHPLRSLVYTKYQLHAFVQLSNDGEEITSEALDVEFCPHVDPSIAIKSSPHEMRHTSVKDDIGKVLGEATLFCENENGIIFGSDCQLSLVLLIRQSEAKYLPRKAKIQVREIHKSLSRQLSFVLSHANIVLPPEKLKPHQECTIPLCVPIPVPEIYSRRGATGLPTLNIGGLQVEYCIRISIPLQHSRFKPSTITKAIVVDCPIVVGNVKPKDRASMRKVPRLVVNAEGEGMWDSQSTGSREIHHGRKDIVEWSEASEIPRFLAGGDFEEDDIV